MAHNKGAHIVLKFNMDHLDLKSKYHNGFIINLSLLF